MLLEKVNNLPLIKRTFKIEDKDGNIQQNEIPRDKNHGRRRDRGMSVKPLSSNFELK